MKITPKTLTLNYKEKPSHFTHLSVIGISCHSTSNNTRVENWVIKPNGIDEEMIQKSNMTDSSDEHSVVLDLSSSSFTSDEQKRGSTPEPAHFSIKRGDKLVFCLALSCHYLITKINSLLIQGTGIFIPSKTGTNKVMLFEVANQDMNVTPVYRPKFTLELDVEYENEDDNNNNNEDNSVGNNSRVQLFSYPEITKMFTKMRFPNAVNTQDYKKVPFLVFKTQIDLVSTTTEWVAGIPFPFWRGVPLLIRKQKASKQFLVSLINITKNWVESGVKDKQLRWAQLACQLGTTSIPYAKDYCVCADEETGPNKRKGPFESVLDSDIVRDITFSPEVFGFGDCEDVAYLGCSIWLLLMDCEGVSTEWDEVRNKIKKLFREPMVTYCRLPCGNDEKTVSHVTCLVLPIEEEEEESATLPPIMIDGCSIVNSFIGDGEHAKQNVEFHANVLEVVDLWGTDDLRIQNNTYSGGKLSNLTLVAYMVNPDGHYYFAERTTGEVDGLTLGEIKFSMLRKADMPDNMTGNDHYTKTLKPLPPVNRGEITSNKTSSSLSRQAIGRIQIVQGNEQEVHKKLISIGAGNKYDWEVEKLCIPKLRYTGSLVGCNVIVFHFYEKT